LSLDPTGPAQLVVEAAARLVELGALPPASVVSPLPTLLTACVASLGFDGDTAWRVVAAAAFLAAAAFTRRAASHPERRLWMLELLAPSRWLFLFAAEDLERLLFWSLAAAAPFLLRSWIARGSLRSAAAAAFLGAAMLASHPAEANALDALALAERIATTTLVWVSPSWRVAASSAALLLAPSAWHFVLEPALRPPYPPMPQALIETPKARPANLVAGPQSLFFEGSALLRESAALIRSPGRLEESLLWLRATAAAYVAAPSAGKFLGQLEKADEQDGWALFRLPQSSAEAVVVSRIGGERLRPIRGVLDVEGVEAYVAWAARPRSLLLRESSPSEMLLRADLGPDDLILIRRRLGLSWSAASSSGAVSGWDDPLGFRVLDPGAGRHEIRLHFKGSLRERLLPRAGAALHLARGEFPRIQPEGIVDGGDFSQPPFSAGTTLSLFGKGFETSVSVVWVGDRRVEPLWSGEAQINFRLPNDTPAGSIEVIVETDGRRSYAEPIEVRP